MRSTKNAFDAFTYYLCWVYRQYFTLQSVGNTIAIPNDENLCGNRT